MAGSSDVVAASGAVDISGAESFRDAWARRIYPVIKPDYEELMLMTPLRMKAKQEKLLDQKDNKERREDANIIRRSIFSAGNAISANSLHASFRCSTASGTFVNLEAR